MRGRIKIVDMLMIKEKIEEYKISVFFFIGLIIGSLFINLFCDYFYDKLGIYSSYFLSSYKSIDVDSRNLFIYSLKEKSLEVFVVLFFSCIVFGKIFVNLYVIYKGMAISLLISSAIIKYGLGGIIVYIVTIFPHYITYGMLIYMIIRIAYYLSEAGLEFRRKKYMGVKNKENIKGIILEITESKKLGRIVLVLLLLLLATSFLEGFVSIKIIKNIL